MFSSCILTEYIKYYNRLNSEYPNIPVGQKMSLFPSCLPLWLWVCLENSGMDSKDDNWQSSCDATYTCITFVHCDAKWSQPEKTCD